MGGGGGVDQGVLARLESESEFGWPPPMNSIVIVRRVLVTALEVMNFKGIEVWGKSSVSRPFTLLRYLPTSAFFKLIKKKASYLR